MIAGVPGHEIPDNLDGVDMSAVWTGNITVQYRRMPTGSEEQQPLIWFHNDEIAVLSDQFKYIARATNSRGRQLFDVDEDPTESWNLWGQSGYTAMGNRLQAIANEYLDQIE